MSYTKDPDILTRGVGAIASRDAGSLVRLRARQLRARKLRQRDARVRNLTYDQRGGVGLGGPGLTAGTASGHQATAGRMVQIAPHMDYGPGPGITPTARQKTTGAVTPSVMTMYVCPDGTKVSSMSMCAPAAGGGGTPGFSVGTRQPKPGGGTPGADNTRGFVTTTPPTSSPPLVPPPPTMYLCSDGSSVSDPSMCVQPSSTPTAPTPDTSTTGGGSGGGGGGGGGTTMLTCADGTTKVYDLSQCPVPPSSSSPVPDVPAGGNNGLLIAAGIGILYLLFRDKKDQR